MVGATGVGLTPERWLPVLFVPALVLRRGKRYLLDFVPLVVLLLAYEECRGLAHIVHARPFYRPQIELEKIVGLGTIPSHELQRWLWSGHMRTFDQIVIDVWHIHFLVPPLLAFLCWVNRRALFYRFAATMLVLSFAGALAFAIFPAAPPWAASDRGLIPHTVRIEQQGAVLVASEAMPAKGFSAVKLRNPYAAIPSLHGGYSLLVFLFVCVLVWRKRWRWWAVAVAALYPLAQGFAVVYTGNHYVVDLLIGYVFCALAFVAVDRFWRARGWPR
jgi:hypothetical protein